jgi:hypothetical protein
LQVHHPPAKLDDRFDPAALLLIAMSAGNALAVYPQLARGLFAADSGSSDLVEHYAEQLAQLISHLHRANEDRLADTQRPAPSAQAGRRARATGRR